MDLEKVKPNIRHLSEMKELLYNPAWADNQPNLELYFMYRDLSENKQDHQKIIKHNLRYDITVMPPMMLGQEYNKTAGHDHPVVPNTDLTYPELYQVLEGETIFLLQDSQNDEIKDVYAIKAQKNDKIIVPPNYEHLIINVSSQELKTANWICRNFGSNVYKPFRTKHGFSYYALKSENGINWVKNNNYTSIDELTFKQPDQWLEQFGIKKDQDIYSLAKDLNKLNFLKQPQHFEWK